MARRKFMMEIEWDDESGVDDYSIDIYERDPELDEYVYLMSQVGAWGEVPSALNVIKDYCGGSEEKKEEEAPKDYVPNQKVCLPLMTDRGGSKYEWRTLEYRFPIVGDYYILKDYDAVGIAHHDYNHNAYWIVQKSKLEGGSLVLQWIDGKWSTFDAVRIGIPKAGESYVDDSGYVLVAVTNHEHSNEKKIVKERK